MSQLFDASGYFTRVQSDQRFVQKPRPAPPPAAVAITGFGLLVSNPGTSYFTLHVTDPVTPAWFVGSGYVSDYRFLATTVVGGITQQANLLLPWTASGNYELDGMLDGAAYTIVVHTIDADGQESATGPSTTGTTTANTVAPAAPVISVAAGTSGAVITLTAANSEVDFSQYVLSRSQTTTTSFAPIATFPLGALSGLSFTDWIIPATAAFYYQLRAYNTSGLYADSNIAGPVSLVSTAVVAPAVPNLVGPPLATVTPSTTPAGALVLTFLADTVANAPNLMGYRIYRRVQGLSFWVLIDTVLAAPGLAGSLVTYTDLHVLTGMTYQYTSSAFDNQGNDSGYDAVHVVSGVAASSGPLQAPGAPLSYWGQVGSIRVGWLPTPTQGIQLYQLSWRYRLVGASEYITWSSPFEVQGTEATIYSLDDPDTGVPLTRELLANQFQVRVAAAAQDGSTSGYLSRPVTFPELTGYRPGDTSIPPAPDVITPTVNADSTITLAFLPPSIPDAAAFHIEKMENDNGIWESFGSVQDVTPTLKLFTTSGLEPFAFAGKQYRFRVRTEDNFGNLTPGNQLLNPEFRTSNAGWQNATTPVTPGFTGAGQSLRVSNLSQPYQIVPVSAGLMYCWSGYFLKDASALASAAINVAWLNGASTVLSTTLGGLVAVSTGWQRWSSNLVAPAGATQAKLSLTGGSNNLSLLWSALQLEASALPTPYSDGKTDLLQAVNSAGPADYTPINLTAVPALGAIQLNWTNPLASFAGQYEYINATMEVWREVTVSGQSSLPVAAVFTKIAEVPVVPDGTSNGYDDLDPDEAYNITASYKIRGRSQYGNVGVFLNGGTAVSATSQSFNDRSIVIIPPITSAQAITDNAMALALQALGKLSVLTGLPTLPNATYPAGHYVYLSANSGSTLQGLYYSTGSAWQFQMVDRAVQFFDQIVVGQISAGAVTASAIATGMLSALTISAGQLTAANIDGTNLHVQAAHIDGVLTIGQVPPSVVRQNANSLLLRGNFEDGSIGSWGPGALLAPGSQGGVSSGFTDALEVTVRDTDETANVFPVVPGQVIFTSGMCYTGGAGMASLFGCAFLNSSQAVLTWTAGCGLSPGLPWTSVSGSMTVPAGAAYATPWIQMSGFPTGGQNAVWCNLFMASLNPGQITTTTIADGSITTGKIVAGAITAGQIAAGTITSAQIATGTLTAAQIAAGTITATQLNVSSINGVIDAETANFVVNGAITTLSFNGGTFKIVVS